jgi:hypothetical protein
MGNSLKFELRTPPINFIQEAKKRLKLHGGGLMGDDQSGTFHVKGVEGDYDIQNNTLVIRITKKPRLRPLWLVKKIVKDQLDSICGITAT